MKKLVVRLLHEALNCLHDLPPGIDPEGVNEMDTSPEDMTFHVGSIAARRIVEALTILEKL